MKIVEVISDTNIGGAGVLLVNRLKNTDLETYNTTVLLPRGSALAARLRDVSAEVIEIKCIGDKSFDVFAVFKYLRIIKRLAPDVINCHGALSARIAAKLCRVPVKICTRHCVFPPKYKNKLLVKIIGKINTALSDRFIAVAYAARQNLLELGVDKDKITVIINGAEQLKILDSAQKSAQRKSLDIATDEIVLIMNARLEAYKGHIWFFEAVKQLIDDGLPIKVLLLGEGSEKEHLLELCGGYCIDKYVIFAGFVDDVAPYMNIADININCSIGTETSSLALSEGMSLGLPAIVSDYGGNPYMVRNGENGYVCRAYDHNALAKCVKKLTYDKELYSKMSKAAVARFNEELNAVAMTKKTTALYDNLYVSYQKRGHIPSIFVDIEK
ncbi:MAG: glycosyltransferase [Ruminococcaceae bacterium]|nr:glycosyltransferase [Oscillospiraceae bacterium]